MGGALIVAAALAAPGASALAEKGSEHPRGEGSRAERQTGERPGARAQAGPGCRISEADLLGVDDSPILARVRENLDERVERGKLSPARADRQFARTAVRVTVHQTHTQARIAPLLALLDMEPGEFAQARRDGLTLREIAEDLRLDRKEIRSALREGRHAARAAVDELCGREARDKAPRSSEGEAGPAGDRSPSRGRGPAAGRG
ncbi:hypothetical protein [Miltoncostaea oceani]|uniref:hypothetical protein n=1 Tax=Miltoncostaea oceani TaxID=2843216 RepID=UPI001C3C8E84|nr:hypothetical protein [Miltoncostaea oceani]